jgi:hypothetical protein
MFNELLKSEFIIILLYMNDKNNLNCSGSSFFDNNIITIGILLSL